MLQCYYYSTVTTVILHACLITSCGNEIKTLAYEHSSPSALSGESRQSKAKVDHTISRQRRSNEDKSAIAIVEEMFTKDAAWITGNITFPETILHTSLSVKIGSFNMKQYGPSKAKKTEVLKIIAKIVSRYDIIGLQEITDAKGRAIKTLIETINQESSYPFQYIVSPRVGRTKQKEQYGLFYRPGVFDVKNYMIYNDTEGDLFSREPLIAEAILKQNGERIGIINVHVTPKDAPKEIDALTQVHAWVEKNMGVKNILIIGDLNADCDYIRKKDLPNIRLLNDNKYKWLISNEFDTTVGSTDCTYDRIIISGTYLEKNVENGSPQTFKFDEEFGLGKESALNVSDHYPVEFSLIILNPPKDISSGSGSPLKTPPFSIFCVTTLLTLSYVIFGVRIMSRRSRLEC